MSVFELRQGGSPLILGLPHTGTDVPETVWARLNDNGQRLDDTDWHIHELYADLVPDITTVRATFHRYVIDANRDPSGVSLYPGQNTTGLVPTTDFNGQTIWKIGEEPDAGDIEARLNQFHRPYHAALAAEIDRVKAIHGLAVVYDCHSIRSTIPFLFEGRLPDFNIGTDGGMTCDPRIEASTFEVASTAREYSAVANGRFRGGWTTRHYGQPEVGVHAIQMELAQATHLASETLPYAYDAEKADKLRVHLKEILVRLERAAFDLKNKVRS